ncbi:ABC transporter ATP-binding protein [Desulfurobacterium atlanticum]|uniref:Iron(III) transport system ATP-binding protein n=1 Tax=Desulfurobacterium atlanticum TaxID=240169 RepID=A0A238Z8R1_9BACT|nr:ABC transporter ATP-binding protein [Desulfurobacterium atlanticum]SNR79687.1 iron(III) transport system ATP-binding protein [Desulfurobacterium atlanticum]
MGVLVLENVRKSYKDVEILKRISLDVEKGEFLTLLGPSGCGKTTTLRIIAGLEVPTSGRVVVDGKIFSAPKEKIFIPPEKRNIGMVFQSYAVWPHMTVFDNIVYPLKIRKLKKQEIERKVKDALNMVRLSGLERRYPHQLSGGQQQRVALARALVMNPKIMLLDEPLSNLDAKLREEMRFEIKDLQKRTGITIIYVTHDQTEAMAMSDRVVVMKNGEIRQIGTPMEIYKNPVDTFVADFIGSANFITPKKVEKCGNCLEISFLNRKLTVAKLPHEKIKVVVRPSEIELSKEKLTDSIDGRVVASSFLGEFNMYKVMLEKDLVLTVISDRKDFETGDTVFVKIKNCVVVADRD